MSATTETDAFDRLFDRAVALNVCTQAAVDELTDSVASGAETEDSLVEKWRPRVAGTLRTVGNEHFRAGRREEALDAYQESVTWDRTNEAAWSNLALVHLKMGDFEGAKLAADTALNLQGSDDPPNRKALHRRGLAREALGDLHAAVIDLEVAGVADDLKRVREKLKAKQQPPATAGKSRAQRRRRRRREAAGAEDVEESDDNDNLIDELIDIKDDRLRRVYGDNFDPASLPRIEMPPFDEMSR